MPKFTAQIIIQNGKEAELTFLAEKMVIDSGCLIFYSETNTVLATFGNGCWRGAWLCGEDGLPSSMQHNFKLNKIYKLSQQDNDLNEKHQLDPDKNEPQSEYFYVIDELNKHQYSNLFDFSQKIKRPNEEVEKAIIFNLTNKKLNLNKVINHDIQRTLDLFLPDLIRQHKPKKPTEILSLLNSREETKFADAIQLKVWMIRNPKKSSN